MAASSIRRLISESPDPLSTSRRSSSSGEPATSANLQTWPAWIELESEPAYFNKMLKDFGVRGIKVVEVIDFDDLPILAQPIHALIFLYKYKESIREDRNAHYPKEVWFARQVPHNACATFALLNIVYNIPDLELGVQLQSFKQDTMDMSPLDRGNEIDQLHFVRAIHNSFATSNELIAADQALQETIGAAKKRQKAAIAKKAREERAVAKRLKKQAEGPVLPTRASGRMKRCDEDDVKTIGKKPVLSNGSTTARPGKQPTRKSARRRQQTDTGEAAFHFCAYMPINGKVWKLDGMEPTPEDMGNADHHWLDLGIAAIQEWIERYNGQIEFNLMAVINDTAQARLQEIAAISAWIRGIERELGALAEDWREMLDDEDKVDHDDAVNDIHADMTPMHRQKLEKADDLCQLIDLRKAAMAEKRALQNMARDEVNVAQADDRKAEHKRHDYARFVRQWMEELAEADILNELMTKV